MTGAAPALIEETVRVVVDGSERRVTVRRAGVEAPSLPPFVLLHGAEMGARFFDPLAAALVAAGAGEVLAPSLPGRDGTDGPPLATVEELARFVAALLAQAVARPAILVGHSLGGGVALATALAAQAAAPDGSGGSPPRGPTLAGLALLATGARLRVHPAILGLAERRVADPSAMGPLDAQLATASPSVRAILDAAIADTPPATALADWRAADRFDRLHALTPLRRHAALAAPPLPTLVMAGADDRLTPPKYAEHLAEHLAATLRVLPDEAHLFPLTAPAATAEHLLALARRAASPDGL